MLFLKTFRWFHHQHSSSLLMVNAYHAEASPLAKAFALGVSSSTLTTLVA
jgi:hypothetical protein